jgi:hypothetical protein
MAHPLDGVRAKLKRAAKHRRELNAKVRTFLATEPYRVLLEPDEDPGYAGWYLGVFSVLQEPPLEFSVIAGEVFGQYRSALDHLMSQLMMLRGTAGSTFPIYPAGRFWAIDKKGHSPRQRIEALVRPEHLAIIERLQEPKDAVPRRGSTRALLITKWFSNLDKHELVRPSFLAMKKVHVSYEDHIAGFDFLWAPAGNLYDGTKLYRVRFVSKEQMEVPFSLQVDLTFGDSPYPWLPIERIGDVSIAVRRIVQRFVRVTPEFRNPNPN